ncbi:MAG TPA: Arc family DNA-binding protein [Acetobacteraceae bacterium]|nr:Arc family DNA-binding protein [Acetobacteraceae bacterium]
MPLNLSIKNAPDDLVQRLRERARRNHRSLQGEMLAIIEAAVAPVEPKLSAEEFLEEIRKLGLTRRNEAASPAREDRDAGHQR